MAANWKMNKISKDAEEFLEQFKKIELNPERQAVICPPFTLLHALKDSGFKFGAQNMHYKEDGAYTGEISPVMLKDLGCEYVIIGHSERRQLFGETDENVNKKVLKALEHDLTPILCLGETEEQRNNNETMTVVNKQLKLDLAGVKDFSKIIIAYEPIWAIGTGNVATPEQAQEVHAEIRKFVGENTTIQYGGSVKPDNIAELMAKSDIDGALVGGASLDAGEFGKIVNY